MDQEEAVIWLRKLTRTREETRIHLCTTRLLSALLPLISSRYSTIQVNCVAALVNLSLEKKPGSIDYSGIVPPLIDVLIGGFPEPQDRAAGALLSLALDDQKKLQLESLVHFSLCFTPLGPIPNEGGMTLPWRFIIYL